MFDASTSAQSKSTEAVSSPLFRTNIILMQVLLNTRLAFFMSQYISIFSDVFPTYKIPIIVSIGFIAIHTAKHNPPVLILIS